KTDKHSLSFGRRKNLRRSSSLGTCIYTKDIGNTFSLNTHPISQIDFWGQKCRLPQKSANNPTFEAKSFSRLCLKSRRCPKSRFSAPKVFSECHSIRCSRSASRNFLGLFCS